MFRDESCWIKEKLSGLELPPGCGVLNIGSSDAAFLATQPYIDANVFAPLRERGCVIANLDIRPAGPGDYSADITEKDLPDKLGRRFGLVVCTSLLEHVTDRSTALDNIAALAADGGYILLTVPEKYPWHPDPIDTLYRPAAAELAAELLKRRNGKIVAQEDLQIRHPLHYHFESRFPFWGYRKFIFWRRWFPAARWKMACVLLRAAKP